MKRILPLTLPKVTSYKATGTGESPLALIDEWVNTTDKETGLPAKEKRILCLNGLALAGIDLRYIDPDNDEIFCDLDKEKYWMPVDLYIGGSEHAVLHLLYARFWHKLLFDLRICFRK